MSDDVTFMRGNERIERLAERSDLAEDVARVRRDMEDADRTYAMGLAALRQAADLTQVELAKKLGVSQAAVSRRTTSRPAAIHSERVPPSRWRQRQGDRSIR